MATGLLPLLTIVSTAATLHQGRRRFAASGLQRCRGETNRAATLWVENVRQRLPQMPVRHNPPFT
jgi:hypothetical protein